MSLSNLITTGQVSRAQRVVVYGPNGVGKTTLAQSFPDTVFLDLEDGTTHIDVPRIKVENAAQLFEAIRALGAEPHDYKNVALDTIDPAETFLKERVCSAKEVKSIENISYGKGWPLLREEFTNFLQLLDRSLNRKGLNVLVIGHSQTKKVQPPGVSDAYDRYELKLDLQNANHLKEWADAVLFLNWDIRTQETSSGKIRGVGGKERVVYTVHTAAWDAKNRVGLPEKVDATFEALSPLLSPIINPVTELADKLADLDQDVVSAYLASIKWSTDGLTGISQKHAHAALERLAAIRKAIEQFGQERLNVSLPVPAA